MAILSESNSDDTPVSLVDLKIPPDYARYDAIGDNEILDRLDQWKSNALEVLEALRETVKQRDNLSDKDASDIIYTVAALIGGEWSSERMTDAVAEILKPYDNASVALLEQVLAQRVKPVFQTNPHPLLNSNTGRKMPRAAGGLMATQDAYEGQAWKEHPGIANVLLWCLQRIDTDAYERLWYLVVPPTMTLLDDFEVRYKLEGIQVVAAMLERAPPDLLRRAGVADLVFASLQRSLTFLHSPSTPDVIRASVPTAVSLVLRTTQPGSETRFNQLCALLGDGIIGSVWMYAYQDPDAIEASVDVLPTLLEAMDIGAVRYLKAIIPQLTHPLIPNSYGTQVPGLQMASLKALLSVIRHCAPRMFKWKGTLLEAVGKCWVTLLDSGKTDKVSLDQRQALREVCVELLKAAPSAREDFDKLLSLDKLTFESLVGDKIALI